MEDVNEAARNAWDRLKALSQGLAGRSATRAASRLSKWANPTHAQWEDVNKDVTKDMVRQIWNISDSEAKKGRWKISKCTNDQIKLHAERIWLEVYGHQLHNGDCALYFAKMLYAQFVQGRPVDFGSKDVNITTHDIREDAATFTREQLALAVQGAGMETTHREQTLQARLAEKEQEAERITQASQTPPASAQRLETNMQRLREEVQSLKEQLNNPIRQGSHIIHHLSHPEQVVGPIEAVGSSGEPPLMCPTCLKGFDAFTGYYTLPCGHIFHLVCVVRQMQSTAPKCLACDLEIPQQVYQVLGMGNEYKFPRMSEEIPSTIRNLFS